MERKLVIFDGNAIMYRAFHALPPLTTKSGEPINAVYGLVSMLINIIENLKPTHIIFCFDEKEKTFRNKLLPTYQSQRPEMADELATQFQKARDFLKAAGIPVYSKAGFEADDVIGTIATSVASKEDTKTEVVIVTGDRDILQIVDDSKNIKLFMPIAGLSNGKIFTEKETVERLGVLPKLIPDYKALVGDASDNYFGIPGIGPKTAITLIDKYKSFGNIYKNIDDIQEKLKEKLIRGKDSGDVSFKLATIVKDVSLEFNIDESQDWNVVSEQVLKLFDDYGFKTLTNRIKSLGKKLEDEKQGSLF